MVEAPMGFEGLAKRLKRRATELEAETDSKSVHFVEATWRDWLGRAQVDPDVVEAVFAGIGDGVVTRPELRKLALHADDSKDQLVLLIATLIWGRGKRNGRMRDPIIRVINGQSRDEVLQSTANLARQGKAADAYKEWKLAGLGPAFFTKWLWAASSMNTNACLVLDSRVWASLGALGWNSLEAAGRRDWPSRYAAYVAACNQCAGSVGVRGEDIEYVLFRQKGKLAEV
jgi:hypothetical protein